MIVIKIKMFGKTSYLSLVVQLQLGSQKNLTQKRPWETHISMVECKILPKFMEQEDNLITVTIKVFHCTCSLIRIVKWFLELFRQTFWSFWELMIYYHNIPPIFKKSRRKTTWIKKLMRWMWMKKMIWMERHRTSVKVLWVKSSITLKDSKRKRRERLYLLIEQECFQNLQSKIFKVTWILMKMETLSSLVMVKIEMENLFWKTWMAAESIKGDI